MRTFLRETAIGGGVAAATAGAVFLLGLSPWSPGAAMTSVPVFLAVMFIISLAAALGRPSTYERRKTVRLAFVGELMVLIFYGPIAMTIAAVAAVTASALARPRRGELTQLLADAPTAAVASLTGGYAYTIILSNTFPLASYVASWPGRTLPITVALVVYALSARVIGRLADSLVARRAASTIFLRDPFRLVPSHVIAGAVGVFAAEVLVREAWDLLPAAAVPLSFAWAEMHRRRSAVDDRLAASESGIATLDEEGRIVAWNAQIGRMLECPPEQAIGRPLTEAVPALSECGALAMIEAALRTRAPQVAAEVAFRSGNGFTHVLTMTAASDPAGALTWIEVSEAPMNDASPRAAMERLALIARSANDGLWEINSRTQALWVSPRWRQIVGLGEGSEQVSRDEWLSRVHPDDLPSLLQAIEAHVLGRSDRLEQEHRLRHADGRYRRVLCRGVGARDPRGRMVRIAGSITDITETASVRDQMVSAGQRDSLTGLLNRNAFVSALAVRLEDYKERRGPGFAALCLDIDRFKVINDSLGHVAGDQLLIAVSRRLEKCTRDGDAIARVGGDEFALLVHGLGDATQANVVAFRIQEALCQPLMFGGREIVTSASIGIAFSRREYASPEEVIRDADAAMHHAKTHGKARHELYDADMHRQTLDRLGFETDLRNAVKAHAFEVYYQPIVSLNSRMCIGFESLIRWKRNGKFVSPAEFIPMAEELGLIDSIGTWVMEQACRSFVEWQRRFPAAKIQYITVNVSARQLIQQGFTKVVEDVVEKTGITPADLRLEITETAVMDAPRAVAEVLSELRNAGFKIYLDDFGTGYSSLSHLHKLPVDALKIDQSFVRGLLLDDRPAIVESILALARTLHTGVVAEGVEDERQAHELQRLGCLHAQGYLFSRPIPVPDVEALLREPRPLGTVPPARANVVAMRA
jgi:diguanylate cyclase (GGDEF)-like protein/PAS domain S-box-containing protein